MEHFEPIPVVPPQVAVETLIFIDAVRHLHQGQVFSCDLYESAMRKGYRQIAARDDLAALAEQGLGLYPTAGIADWLVETDEILDSAVKLFVLNARVSEGRPLSNAEIQAGAARVAEFYTRYSASSVESPAIAAYIRKVFAAVLVEMQKVMPDAVRPVVLAPTSASVQ